MTSIVRPVSKPPLLLPSPEGEPVSTQTPGAELQGPLFIPAQFEEIVATAVLDYAAGVNAKNRSRGGQAVLKLNPEGQKLAAGVIFDAIQLAKEKAGQSVLPTKPTELQRLIKTGLKLRETERLAAQQLINELKRVSATGAKKPIFYDLGLDKELVEAAKQDAFNYPIIPQPENARQLMAMVPARRLAVKQMAVIAAVTDMADRQEGLSDSMPAAQFITANLEIIDDLLDQPGKQAPVDRGALIAERVGQKKGKGLNPTYLEPKDLQLVIKTFDKPPDEAATEGLTTALASRLLTHSPELIPTGTAALQAFSGQISQAVILEEKAKLSRGEDEIAYLTARAEIFGILPIRPMLGSEALILRADYLTTAKPDTHHLWGDAIKMTAGPGRMTLIPTPEKLVAAKALLSSIQTSDDRFNDDRERLFQAVKAWRAYKNKKLTLPEKIKKLDKRIEGLGRLSRKKFSIPDEVKNLHPLQLDNKIFGISGAVSTLTRRINQANVTLATHKQLSTVAESAAPAQFASRYLAYRQKQAWLRTEAFEREAGENPTFGQESPFLLTDFPRRLSTSAAESVPETAAEELIRITGYLDELVADKTKPLPEIYLGDLTALYNYFRLCQKKLIPVKGSQSLFQKMSTGMSILINAKSDNIGTTFWRSWFIREANKRKGVLEARLKRAERYHADRAELKDIGDALAGKDFELMKETAQRLSGGQRSATLTNWIKMQAAPPDFLKRLKVSGQNNESPESKQLKDAEVLVKLYRDAKSRVQMRIPGPNRINETIENKLRAAENYKSAKIATIETMGQLKLIWKRKNPLVPLDISQGATLAELVEATASRIAVARATMELDGLVADRETARQEIAELKKLRSLKQKAVSVDRLKFQREARMKELKMADTILVETMQALNWAADPEMIPKSK